MTDELIFLIIAVLDFSFVLVASRLGKSWLIGAIVLNLLLISVFGAKLVSVFGFVTNSGNVFYAAVFFATQLLVERYGVHEAHRSILLGTFSILFFILMSQLIILTQGRAETQAVNLAIETLFHQAPRIAFASLIAYVISSLINIELFDLIKVKTKGRFAWLRLNLSNITGQLADSLIFFTVAFFGMVSPQTFLQTLIVGFLLKVGAGGLTTPFFYFDIRARGE